MSKMLKRRGQIVLTIFTVTLTTIPAKADVAGDEFFLPHCVTVTNLGKYSKYQIIARVGNVPKPNQEMSFTDVTMIPGSCIKVSYKQAITLHASDKSGVETAQPKLIPGNLRIPYYYKYTDDNSELPWYISDVQDELEIVEITPSAFSLKQKTVYHYNHLYWALSFAAAVVLIITWILKRFRKLPKSLGP
jgi:hypothetical protein